MMKIFIHAPVGVDELWDVPNRCFLVDACCEELNISYRMTKSLHFSLPFMKEETGSFILTIRFYFVEKPDVEDESLCKTIFSDELLATMTPWKTFYFPLDKTTVSKGSLRYRMVILDPPEKNYESIKATFLKSLEVSTVGPKFEIRLVDLSSTENAPIKKMGAFSVLSTNACDSPFPAGFAKTLPSMVPVNSPPVAELHVSAPTSTAVVTTPQAFEKDAFFDIGPDDSVSNASANGQGVNLEKNLRSNAFDRKSVLGRNIDFAMAYTSQVQQELAKYTRSGATKPKGIRGMQTFSNVQRLAPIQESDNFIHNFKINSAESMVSRTSGNEGNTHLNGPENSIKWDLLNDTLLTIKKERASRKILSERARENHLHSLENFFSRAETERTYFLLSNIFSLLRCNAQAKGTGALKALRILYQKIIDLSKRDVGEGLVLTVIADSSRSQVLEMQTICSEFLEKLYREYQQLLAANSELRTQCSNADSKAEELSRLLQEKVDECTCLKGEIQGFTKYQTLQKERDIREEEKAEKIRIQFSELKGEHAAAERELTRLRNENASLVQKMKEVETATQKAELEQQVLRKETSISIEEHYRKEIEQIQRELENATYLNTSLNQELNNAMSECSNYRNYISQLEGRKKKGFERPVDNSATADKGKTWGETPTALQEFAYPYSSTRSTSNSWGVSSSTFGKLGPPQVSTAFSGHSFNSGSRLTSGMTSFSAQPSYANLNGEGPINRLPSNLPAFSRGMALQPLAAGSPVQKQNSYLINARNSMSIPLTRSISSNTSSYGGSGVNASRNLSVEIASKGINSNILDGKRDFQNAAEPSSPGASGMPVSSFSAPMLPLKQPAVANGDITSHVN